MGLVVLSGCAWGQPSPQEVYARSLQPSQIGPVATATTAQRVLTARVWADHGHRRGVLTWQVRLQEQVAAANRVLAATLGARIQVVSMQSWSHEGGRADLQVDLNALHERDAGEGVDIVIGLVSPLAVLSPALHDAGRAQMLGKHMVLRGIEDAQEHVTLRRALDEFSAEERNTLYQARMRHREVSLLLHEVGHLLGAVHMWPAQSLMNAQYSVEQSGFAPENLTAMKMALDARSTDAVSTPESQAALIAYLSGIDAQYIDKESKAWVLARLGGAPAPSHEERTQVDPTLTPQAMGELLQKVQQMLQRGEVEAGWQLLKPQLKQGQPAPGVLGLACELTVRRDPSMPEALQYCSALAKQVPKPPGHHLLLAHALQGAGQLSDALRAAQDAEKRLASDVQQAQPTLWTALAQTYQRLGAITWAGQASAHGLPDVAGQIAVYCRQVRRATWLDSAGIKPEQEPTYVGWARTLLDALRTGRTKQVDSLADTLAKQFPQAPGPQIAVCEYYASRKRWAASDRACRRLVKLHPKQAKGYVALAVSAFARGRPSRAVAHLQRAVKLSPGTKGAWTLLYSAYQATGKAKKAGQLAKRYEARFGKPLR